MKLLYIPIITELKDGIIGLLLTLDGFIYSLISSSYKIFMALAGARLLTASAYQAIANKIYILVGVMMLFVLAYAILKAIVDPDQITKGDMAGSKILKNVVIAIIGLTFSPVIFNFLYQAQGLILENNVLGNLFFRSSDESNQVNLGSQTVGNSTVELGTVIPDNAIHESGGNIVATAVWQAFFYPSAGDEADMNEITASTKDYFLSSGLVAAGCAVAVTAAAVGLGIVTFGLGALLIGAAGGAACYAADKAIDNATAELIGDTMTLEEAYTYSSQTGDFEIYTGFVTEWEEGTIHYTFLISTIIGIFVCYAFISFSIDMGMRCAKLAYYQIIAPIPLILQVLPSFKQQFKNYISSVISTFLEVFIRITVVYVVVYIMCHINDMFSTEGFWNNLGFWERMCARALLIIGLVLFAKQAPKLISETFGIKSGNMSLGIGKKLAEGGAFGAGAVIGSGITNAVRGYRQDRINTKDDPKLKNARVRRVTHALSSGVNGLGAGLFGAGMQQFGSGGKAAGNLKEMKDAISKNAAEADKKRSKRFANEMILNSNPDDSALDIQKKRIKSGLENIKSSVKSWSVGNMDTSVWDERDKLSRKLFDTLKAAQDGAKSDQISAAETVKSKLNGPGSEKEAVINFDTFADKLSKEAVRQFCAEFSPRAGRSLSNVSDLKDYVKSLGPDDRSDLAQFLEGKSSLMNMARKAADDAVKDARKEAVMGDINSYNLTGKHNDTSRLIENNLGSVEFLKSAAKFEHLTIEDDAAGIVKQELGEYLRKTFGEKFTDTGQIDFAKMLSEQASKFTSDLKINGTTTLVDAYGQPVKFSDMSTSSDEAVRSLATKFGSTITESFWKNAVNQDKVSVLVDYDGSVPTFSLDVAGEKIDLTEQEFRVINVDKVTHNDRTGGGSALLANLKDFAERESDRIRSDERYKTAKATATEHEVKQGDKK